MFEQLALLSFGDGGWGLALLSGAGITLLLAVCCAPIGLPLGLLLASAERSRHRFVRTLVYGFSTVFRGLPELLTLFIVYYGFQIGAQKLLALNGWQGQVDISPFVAAMVALSLVLAAFSCEVWSAAFKVVGKGQYQAGMALGMSRSRTFFSIILPQLLRVALPGLSNNWLTLLKDTSLVSTISLVDLMRQTGLAVSTTKEPVLFYSAACAIYLLFAAVSGRAFAWAERRYNRGYGRAG